jgi:uncharacterized RmlC-like cupin family protein
MAFNPNKLTRADGVKRIEAALSKAGVKIGKKVITSRDSDMQGLRKTLAVTNIPAGFTKYQLPLTLTCASSIAMTGTEADGVQFFISMGEPNIKVGSHSHNEGAGLRFIAGGSITYKKKELTAGDWMYIPQGSKYEFQVGPQGAIMCYCYCCCCA